MFTTAKRIFAIVICLTIIATIFLVPAASAATVKLSTTSATYRCATTNTSKLFGITSYVKFTNTSGDFMKITTKASNCSVNKSSITLTPNASYTFSYKTGFTKNGTVDFCVTNTTGCPLRFTYTTTDVRLTTRIK